MSTLHLITEISAFNSTKGYINKDDAVIILGNATNAPLEELNALLDTLKEETYSTKKIYMFTSNTQFWIKKIKHITHIKIDTFIELCCKYNRTVSWY